MKFVDFMADSRDFYTGLIDPVCKKYGLTQMEFNILLFLANNPDATLLPRSSRSGRSQSPMSPCLSAH